MIIALNKTGGDRSNMSGRFLKKTEPYLYIMPYTAIFIVFIAAPALFSFYMGFFEWNLVGSKVNTGLANFRELFQDAVFRKTVSNTLLYTLMYVPTFLLFGLLLALLLNRNFRGSSALKVIVYTPYICMIPAIAIIWKWMMDTNYGLVNYYLQFIGFGKINWLTDPSMVLYTIVWIILWQTVGYSMVIFLAGLQEIPKDIVESAVIDGAGPVRRFFSITLPYLQPSIFFLTVIGFIGALKTFGQPYMITQGGPSNASNTVVMYMYHSGFHYFRMGYAAAISVVLFLFILMGTLILFKVMRRRAF
jgi:ABC-type sugar transport system permease subunit